MIGCRTVRDTLNLIHELTERGVGVRNLADPIKVDSSRPEDPMAQLAVVLLALFTHFTLPKGARQGPVDWWKIRLRYRMRLSGSTKPGFVWISSDTDGRTAASIEYRVGVKRGHVSFNRIAVDVDGQREHRGAGTRDTFTFENYLQYAGVRGGRNSWTFRLEHTPGVRVKRAVILGASAVLSTKTSPYALNLEARVLGRQPEVGHRFQVRVQTLGRNREPIANAVVHAQPPEGVRQLSVDRFDSGVTYSFVSSRVGNVTIGFTGTSGEAHQAVDLTVRVRPKAETADASLGLWSAVLASDILGGLLVIRRRRAAA